MSTLDVHGSFEEVKQKTIQGLSEHFPMKGRTQSLVLEKVEVKDDVAHDDTEKQYNAKLNGDSFSVPVYGHVKLVENDTGKVINSRKLKLLDLPKLTQRYSYILNGTEYQVDNQWQLKTGAYTRRRQNGELETRFNVVGKPAFDVILDPESRVLHMEYGKAKFPLYPMMKAMGVDDDALEQHLGKDVFEANKKARGNEGTVEKFYKKELGKDPPSKEEAVRYLREEMAKAKMHPGTNEITLGKPIDHVNGDAFLLSASKLLKVQAGHEEDDRDSLLFKDLRNTSDFIYDKIKSTTRQVADKVSRKINTAKTASEVLPSTLFQQAITQSFTKNSAARLANQINPLEMIASSAQTTIMGPGGIQSDNQVMDEAKLINPSHLGFIDPITTPEGGRTGISLRLPIGVTKINKEPHMPLYNIKTGKTELVNPATFVKSKVVMPDQVTWKDGKPVPIQKEVKISGKNNDIEKANFSDSDYVMKHPGHLFGLTANTVPFLHNTQGNRSSMATRHIEQAISLVHREVPLVQAYSGSDDPSANTFDKLVGTQAAHISPVAGTVTKITNHAIHLEDGEGNSHKVSIYHNFPSNDAKSTLHSTPVVKVGDKVKSGALLADNNYTKDGVMALGKNLNVAYIPYKGLNFEDGIVISETAAQKMASQHLYKKLHPAVENTILDKKKFLIHNPTAFTKDQVSSIGDDGVIKVGTKVKPGDALVLAMRPFEIKDKTGMQIYRKGIHGGHHNAAMKWDSDVEGEVTAISKGKDGIQVHVKTVENVQVGDKFAGRYGNKGIVSKVLPDHEMPHTKDGKVLDVLLNPSGVPGRINPGQLLETAAAKIADKTGKTYIVKNFEHGKDMVEHVQKELKQHGLSDTEEVIDPVTKESLGQVMTGKQYMLKLVHQVDKKVKVTPGMAIPGDDADTYDLNLQPTDGQRIGSLGMYALLAHGSKANIREMQTWKGEGADPEPVEGKKWASQHLQVWNAIQTGAPLPTPKSTFAFKKFEDLLKGSGVNIEKKGHELILSPLTEKHLQDLTKGRVLTKPTEMVDAKVDPKTGELKTRSGGLFDDKLTGGHGGTQWTAIKTHEPIPNPVFEAPIRAITGLMQKEFDAIMDGSKGVRDGKVVDAAQAKLHGGHAIHSLLSSVDVQSELEKTRKGLSKAKPAEIDSMVKKVKFLKALDELKMKPQDAYVMHHLPVIPPVLRPVSVMDDGNIKFADINKLYKDFAMLNDKMADPVTQMLPKQQALIRKDLYQGMKAITGFGLPFAAVEQKGLLHQVSGASPKMGFFQKNVMQKRQDLTMRSTIVPEPSMSLDDVGIPKEHALKLFSPFVVKKMVDLGYASNPLDARKLIGEKHKHAYEALVKVTEERPVLLKRDPALHKYSIQGFNTKLVDGNAIKIHPLTCGGFNADFDGDTMSLFVPISHEAVQEAHKMKPSNNVFSEATGKIAYTPTLESALGLFKLSVVGKQTSQNFSNHGQVIDAVKSKKLSYTDVITVNGRKTTAGRVLLSTAVPPAMQESILHNLDMRVDKKGLDGVLNQLGKNHKGEFDKYVNKLKDIGNTTSTGVIQINPAPGVNIQVPIGVHTLSLKDMQPDKAVRDPILNKANKEVDALKLMNITPAERDRRQVAIYQKADEDMQKAHETQAAKNPNNLYTMYQAGVKPGWSQYKQLVLAPMLMKDSSGKIIPIPVTKTYSEGVDIADYWTSMHGARRGVVMKVQEVRDPGYMSKLLMNTMMNNVVATHDCGTNKGVLLHVDEKDVHDRVLAHDFKHSSLHVPAGTVLTPAVVSQIKATDKSAKLLVRSPLKCSHDKGTCQKCAGISASGDFHDIGTNIGVHSAQTVGERSVQLAMKEFHTGGVASSAGLANSFARFEQLMMLPKKIQGSASLAMHSGQITKIEPIATGTNVYIDNKKHFVGKDPLGKPLHEPMVGSPWGGIKVGQRIQAGDHISDPHRTIVNPHDLYQATGSIETVQNHLTDQIYGLYKSEGVKRTHVENLVKSMSNLTQVAHPGGAHSILPGEYHTLAHVHKVNEDLLREGKPLVEHKPVLKGVNMLPAFLSEDWMAKLQHQKLRTTIAEGAAMASKTNIHSTHPVPAIAYGAEIGMNETKSKIPGFGHLSNVPKHHY